MPVSLTVNRMPNQGVPAGAWGENMDRLSAVLGFPHDPVLLPPHFLKSAFRRIGGEIFVVEKAGEQAGKLVGGAFLFPRSLAPAGGCGYTLRLHFSPQSQGIDGQVVAELVAAQMDPAPIVLYDTRLPHAFTPTHHLQDGLDLGRPGKQEAEAIRRLQQKVWMVADEYLYPADMHTPDFGLASSLVARDGEKGPVVGSLFGFFKWDESPLPDEWATRFQHRLRQESQSLAVEPDFRGRDIGFKLKRMQAQQALAAGVDLVEWTTDPLLFANAVLNFGKLRAVCTQFFPDLIPFRNALNQLSASRLRMTLLPGTSRVQDALANPDATPSIRHLGDDSLPVRVNDGWSNPLFGVDAPSIAVEIPADWATLQRTDLPTAACWRETTDRLLAHYVGTQPGQYTLTAPARDGDRCFLVGERVDEALLARLGT